MSTEAYILLRQGKVQALNTSLGKMMILALSRADAKKLVTYVGHDGIKRTIDRIGSWRTETVASHVAAAMAEGCVGVACLLGWADGTPLWQFAMD